jgi:asparaginyl-tRNA synthetase
MVESILSKSKDAVVDALSAATEAMNVENSDNSESSPSLPFEPWPVELISFLPSLLSVYIDETLTPSADYKPTGSQSSPYPTPLAALLARGPTSTNLFVKKALFPPKAAADIAGDALEKAANDVNITDPAGYQPIAGAALKKAKKGYELEMKKREKEEANREKMQAKEEEDRKREEKKREEAGKIVLVEDPSLDKAKKVCSRPVTSDEGKTKLEAYALSYLEAHALAPHLSLQAKIAQLVQLRDSRVRVFGWVHRLRRQKDLTFITLREGSGLLQCVLSGQCVRPLPRPHRTHLAKTLAYFFELPSFLQTKTLDALDLNLEASVELVGTVKVVPEGKTAPGGHELVVDWWRTVGAAPGGEEHFANQITAVRSPFLKRAALNAHPHSYPFLSRTPPPTSLPTNVTSPSVARPLRPPSRSEPPSCASSDLPSTSTRSSRLPLPVWSRRQSREALRSSSSTTTARRHT